jgi:hypothetical protein
MIKSIELSLYASALLIAGLILYFRPFGDWIDYALAGGWFISEVATAAFLSKILTPREGLSDPYHRRDKP